ncbi:MAG: ribosome silencing factor [Chloroflexota bacterium]
MTDGLTVARAALDAAASKKAEDIVLLDVQSLTSLADYFVICTAGTERQMQAVLEGIEDDLRQRGARPRRTDGEHDSGWVLADYGDVICHVFKPQERQFYRLEELWQGAKTLVRVQ